MTEEVKVVPKPFFDMINAAHATHVDWMRAALIQSWEGIKAQGGQCRKTFENGELGGCVYRNARTGCKCGVGQLIPDNVYDPKFDDGASGCSSLMQIYAKVGILHMVSYRFLCELQGAHDSNQMLYDMHGAFQKLAKNCGVDPELLTFQS